MIFSGSVSEFRILLKVSDPTGSGSATLVTPKKFLIRNLVFWTIRRQEAVPRGFRRGGGRQQRDQQEAARRGRDPGGGSRGDRRPHRGHQEDGRTSVHVPRACAKVREYIVHNRAFSKMKRC
jgi:hypothetical protein